MDTGALYAALNALDMVQVKRTPNGTFDGLREGSETLPVVTATINDLTGGIELSAGGQLPGVDLMLAQQLAIVIALFGPDLIKLLLNLQLANFPVSVGGVNEILQLPLLFVILILQ